MLKDHRFNSAFPEGGPVILPVNHVRSMEQAMANASIVVAAGASGIMLIDHSSRSPALLIEVFNEVRIIHPKLWVGINFLGLPAIEAAQLCNEIETDGVWVDCLHEVDSDDFVWVVEGGSAEMLAFVGVAFKYQQQVENEDLPSVAHRAGMLLGEIGVITTSGDATGKVPSLEKICLMDGALRSTGCPLAIASGITAENIGDFLPHAAAFLVGTYLENDRSEIQPDRLRKLLAAALP